MRRLAALGAVVLLAGCGSSGGGVDTGADFGNVTSLCLDGFRVFLTQDDIKATSAIAVVADPRCEVSR